MKITTNPGSIIAACNAALVEIQGHEADFEHDEAVRNENWWYRWGLVRWFRSPVDYAAKRRIQALLAIAKHRRDAFGIELDEPWLTDIAVYLDPFEGGRI